MAEIYIGGLNRGSRNGVGNHKGQKGSECGYNGNNRSTWLVFSTHPIELVIEFAWSQIQTMESSSFIDDRVFYLKVHKSMLSKDGSSPTSIVQSPTPPKHVVYCEYA
jgi:hypothetical protein